MFQVLKIPPEEGPPPLWVTAWGGGQVVDLMGKCVADGWSLWISVTGV